MMVHSTTRGGLRQGVDGLRDLLGRRLPGRSSWRADAVVLAMIVAVPVIVFRSLGAAVIGAIYVGVNEHALIESFCGLVALMIAGIALTVALRQRSIAAGIYALAFFSMGALDLLHAATDPHGEHHRFVLLHTMSTGTGAVLILLATLAYLHESSPGRRTTRDIALNLVLGAGFVALLGVAYGALLPRIADDDAGVLAFTWASHAIHRMSAVLYAATAVTFYRHFRHRRQIGLPLGVLFFCFAESADLFGLSTMWDFHWWMWHGVKVAFYVGTLVAVFVGFLAALNLVERSRRVLVRANGRLRTAQRSLQHINGELTSRNSMARDAMRSMDLNNALAAVARGLGQMAAVSGWKLLLKAEPGARDEFQRAVARAAGSWAVDVEPSGEGEAARGLPAAAAVQAAGGAAQDERTDGCVCVPLLASGKRIGYLRVELRDVGGRSDDLSRLEALVAEVGPIINNALLHDNLIAANEFRASLLRISALLTASPDVEKVMEAVCREAARLLDSDGALIWAPAERGGPGELGSWCSCTCGPFDRAAAESWLRASVIWQALSSRAERGPARSEPIVRDRASEPMGQIPDLAGHPIGTIACFPLANEGRLLGVMLLFRGGSVRYGPGTLAKGELLAGVVRSAVNNARSYRQLSDINRQLREAEERRTRGERLAMLGQMSASVAHEVRNPLSAITNCLAVLRGESPNRSHRESAVEIIEREVQRLNRLTSDFLAFGRPRPAAAKPVLLADVIGASKAAIERHVAQEELKVTVVTRVEGSMRPVYLDREGFEAVLWNLMLNAAQAIEEAGEVRVSLRQSESTILLAVGDTGRGIPAAQRAQIFEPFFSQRSHGVGLGLAIVARHVQEWQGRLRVRSRPGSGTVFFVRVPIGGCGAPADAGDVLVEVQ